MDAEKYLKEYQRICNTHTNCHKCPLSMEMNNEVSYCPQIARHGLEKSIKIVEKWSEEHPIMTNTMKFKKVFGCEPRTGKDTYLCIPKAKRDDDGECSDDCKNCLKWWDEEWKEPVDDK